MDAKPILCTASVLQMEIVGTNLAAEVNLGETDTSEAYAVALGVGLSDPITGDAQVRKSLNGRRVCLFAGTHCQSFRQRARSWRRHAVWLPGRVRLFRRVEPGRGTRLHWRLGWRSE